MFVHSDGRMQKDGTLRCEIFALTGVDPGIAVCVRFIDRGKSPAGVLKKILYGSNMLDN